MELKDYTWEAIGLPCWEEIILDGIESCLTIFPFTTRNITMIILDGIERVFTFAMLGWSAGTG